MNELNKIINNIVKNYKENPEFMISPEVIIKMIKELCNYAEDGMPAKELDIFAKLTERETETKTENKKSELKEEKKNSVQVDIEKRMEAILNSKYKLPVYAIENMEKEYEKEKSRNFYYTDILYQHLDHLEYLNAKCEYFDKEIARILAHIPDIKGEASTLNFTIEDLNFIEKSFPKHIETNGWTPEKLEEETELLRIRVKGLALNIIKGTNKKKQEWLESIDAGIEKEKLIKEILRQNNIMSDLKGFIPEGRLNEEKQKSNLYNIGIDKLNKELSRKQDFIKSTVSSSSLSEEQKKEYIKISKER